MTQANRFRCHPRDSATRLRVATCLAITVLSSATCRQRTPELDDVQTMAYAVKPAVVRVNSYATATLTITLPSSNGEQGGVRSIRTGAGGSGSGFVIHPDGLVLTSSHVVSSTTSEQALHDELMRNGVRSYLQQSVESDVLSALARSGEIDTMIERLSKRSTVTDIEVVNRVDLSNGRMLPFEVLRLSPTFARGGDDLALLRIDARGLPTLSLAKAESRLQEQVWIAGYPSVASIGDSTIGGWLSAETDLEPTITSGSITAVRISASDQPIYQTDAPVYPGHSGGPAVNRSGSVVGIPVWGHTDADQIRFLIPASTVRSFLEKAGVSGGTSGPFNEVYRDALAAAASGDWDIAAVRLEEADALFPGSPDVQRFLNEARNAGSTPAFSWTDLTAVLAFGLAALVLITAITRLRRPPQRPVYMPPVTDQITVTPSRGDRNGGDALSLNEHGTRILGHFTILNGNEAGRRLGLGGSGIRIGRESRYCEIVLSDPKISRLHAEVVSFDGRTMLIDRNSSNGTFVNDERIERTFLKDGDVIYFGGRHAVAVAFTL